MKKWKTGPSGGRKGGQGEKREIVEAEARRDELSARGASAGLPLADASLPNRETERHMRREQGIPTCEDTRKEGFREDGIDASARNIQKCWDG